MKLHNLLALLLVPLLTACPEMEELNKSLTGSPTVTSKQKSSSSCNNLNQYIPPSYSIYYTDNTHIDVDQAKYDSVKVGDPK